MSNEDPPSTEEKRRMRDRLPFSRWKHSLLERTRPHKTLHYWVKKAFDERLAIRIIRFIIQLVTFILLFYAGVTFVLGYDPLANSILAGISFLIPLFGFIPLPFDMPHGAAQGTGTGFFEIIQLVGQAGMFPFIALGILFIVPILVGRSFCGWICPFGFVQDLCALTPIRTRYPSKNTDKQLGNIKYIILIVTLFVASWVGLWTFLGIQQDLVAALGPFATAFWSVLNPSGTFFVIIPYLWINRGALPPPLAWSSLMWIRLIFLGIIIFIALFVRRPFCRWFCPVGAALGLVGQFSFLTVSRTATECPGGRCDTQTCKKACPVGIDVMERPYGRIYSTDCIMCLDCVAKCTHDAVKVEYG